MSESPVIDANVSELLLGSKKVTLIGTAHISHESVALVERVIEERRPDVVAIELDSRRLHALQDPERWKQTDLYRVIRDGNSYVLLTQLILQSFQKRISKELGIQPGAEMLTAVVMAQATGARLECIDRDIRLTLKRAWARAGWWSLIKVFFALLLSFFDKNSVDAEEIERLKKSDVLTAALEEFSALLPDVKTSLIDERDAYMAQKLRDVSGQHIVAVVGAGHVPGMLRAIEREHDLSLLEAIPPKSPWGKRIAWAFPVIIVALIAVIARSGGKDATQELVIAWILLTGGLASLGALISFAHPLSIITAFLVAPLATLHPMLRAGWFAGLVEAYLKRPRVLDLENVGEDLVSLRGWWRNRVSHVLLVVALTNIGAAVGRIIGAIKIVRAVL